MGFIYPTGVSKTNAETALMLTAGSLNAYNTIFQNSTDYSTMTQDILLGAGESVTLYWNYVSTDYAPFNDGVFATFVGPGHQEIHLLACTVDAFGDPETIVVGTYGSSGWHSLTLTAPVAGVYRLGFAAFNYSDTILDSWGFLDNAEGGTAAPGEPVVTTATVTNIMPPTADCGGTVTDNGGVPPITARGVCWNTTGVPTIADNFTTDGSGFGAFTSTLTGIVTGQTYYVRAYATNSVDTYYGGEVVFTPQGPATPVSNWALILGGIAIAVFMVLRLRKTFA
jgi:hypothetical protein